jgi:hypothetical protein
MLGAEKYKLAVIPYHAECALLQNPDKPKQWLQKAATEPTC